MLEDVLSVQLNMFRLNYVINDVMSVYLNMFRQKYVFEDVLSVYLNILRQKIWMLLRPKGEQEILKYKLPHLLCKQLWIADYHIL